VTCIPLRLCNWKKHLHAQLFFFVSGRIPSPSPSSVPRWMHHPSSPSPSARPLDEILKALFFPQTSNSGFDGRVKDDWEARPGSTRYDVPRRSTVCSDPNTSSPNHPIRHPTNLVLIGQANLRLIPDPLETETRCAACSGIGSTLHIAVRTSHRLSIKILQILRLLLPNDIVDDLL
jgi:hypothetical protein